MGEIYNPRDEPTRQSYFHEALGDLRTPGFDNDISFELANYGIMKPVGDRTLDTGYFGNDPSTISPQELTNLSANPNFDFQDLSLLLSISDIANDTSTFQNNQEFTTNPYNHNLIHKTTVPNAPHTASNAPNIPDLLDLPQLADSPESSKVSSNPTTPDEACEKLAGEIEQKPPTAQEAQKHDQPEKKPTAKKFAAKASATRGKKRKASEAGVEEDVAETSSNKPPGKRGRKARVFKDNTERQEARGQFLERNRNAASKCREKKKQHTHELQQKHSYLSNENGEMMFELEEMRMELTALIQLLKQHSSNCSHADPQPAIQSAEKKLWDVDLALTNLAQVREENLHGKDTDPLDANQGEN